VIRVEEVSDPAARSRLCEAILRGLPEWFGIESAVVDYVRGVAELPTFAARLGSADEPAGFLSLKLHSPQAAELYVLGVRRELHRRGIGSALVDAAEAHAAARGVELLQVKTLGPSHSSAEYEATRLFYEARGFVALEELPDLWPDNPCLVMVKTVGPAGFRVVPITGLPELVEGDDLAALIVERVELADGDVVVVAQKAVSKVEGRVVRLDDVEPSDRARELAGDEDPRRLEVILGESARIVRARPPLVIAETRHGFVCASAGVDASNTPGPGTLVLLPVDPDASAERLRAGLRDRTGREVGVLVTDSFGRPWRQGTTDVAIGAAGVRVLLDLAGRRDRTGYELHATMIAVADEIAGAAELAMRKLAGVPVAVVRGLDLAGAGRALELVMPAERDLFR
jgi:coenzyme F420-0:L-glutamate ligase/coenzyme F420-1:gamma-L-glutamate ligase